MIRAAAFLAGTVLLLLLATATRAGGPPWLCLPINGVDQENREQCVDLITAKLESKLWPHEGRYRDVRVDCRQDQCYLTFGIATDIRLSEIESALRGSGFSIPRDELCLFGHAVLEIDVPSENQPALLADLKAIDHVFVATSDDREDVLVVTVEMPYPATDGRPTRESVGWKAFRRNDFSTDQPADEPTIGRNELPSYGTFPELVSKHGGNLKDIFWSTNYACRPLGGVALKNPTGTQSEAGRAGAGQ